MLMIRLLVLLIGKLNQWLDLELRLGLDDLVFFSGFLGPAKNTYIDARAGGSKNVISPKGRGN